MWETTAYPFVKTLPEAGAGERDDSPSFIVADVGGTCCRVLLPDRWRVGLNEQASIPRVSLRALSLHHTDPSVHR